MSNQQTTEILSTAGNQRFGYCEACLSKGVPVERFGGMDVCVHCLSIQPYSGVTA